MPNPNDLDPSRSPLAFFGSEVRLEREKAGMSQQDLGKVLYCSGALVGYIEAAKRYPTLEFAERCDEVFGTGGFFVRLWPLVSRFVLPHSFRHYVDFEAGARAIRTYQAQTIYGLLQTEDYARAVMCTSRHEDLDAMVAARMERQRILQRPEAPKIWAVLDEAVLRRRPEDDEAMRVQLQRLLDYRYDPKMVIQILPFRAGFPASLDGSFNLLSMDEGADLVYSEGVGTAQVLAHPEEFERAGFRYDLLRTAALSAEDSWKLIASLLEEL
ncbi:helix-turn-helix transcriptional regulator [Streptomyces sp. NBS 14/10]|uniref:helix-turn-helix domain-containing protein n=1 Tax=Streptomyces sp. NBS 14/10 TaxID=1945643 RepID=UPI000B7DF225|nr:helix-turn-helix transcriptional regulator [Streptomyces sp. NBS 14/10]KAK1181239.1 helix-turn-helix transcriptional regulator [Streptomyces sp. NBS 14/10]